MISQLEHKLDEVIKTIKTLEGHLTANDKKVVKHLIDNKIWKGRVGKKDWYIADLGKNKYEVTYVIKDRGKWPVAGSPLQMSTYKHTVVVK